MLPRKKDPFAPQTLQEEFANSITHGFGLLLSLIACALLIYNSITRGDTSHIVSSSIYGGSLVTLYTISTLYHACQTRMKKLLRRLDHISIYLLIAGTYMPITLIVLQGVVGWTLFILEYLFCVIGIAFKIIFGHRFEALSGAFYLIMGWLAIFAIEPIVATLPFYGILSLFLGGIFYTLGFIFFALDTKYHYFHTIWHMFVLAGSFAHFYLIFYYVIP
ncbi:MAG: hemolysin III family protein [Chlamydiales bacterium]|nr:hemolysin III family protein [Chlamydiales bacterium]